MVTSRTSSRPNVLCDFTSDDCGRAVAIGRKVKRDSALYNSTGLEYAGLGLEWFYRYSHSVNADTYQFTDILSSVGILQSPVRTTPLATALSCGFELKPGSN